MGHYGAVSKGLSKRAQRAYQALLDREPVELTEEAAEELRGFGLLTGPDASPVAVPPADAVRSLVVDRIPALAAELGDVVELRRDLDEMLSADGVSAYGGGSTSVTGGVVEWLGTPEDRLQASRYAAGAAERDLLWVHARVRSRGNKPPPVDSPWRERGLRVRVVVSKVTVQDPAIIEDMRHSAAAGAEHRVHDEVPVSAILCDDSIAMISVGAQLPSGALLVRAPGLVAALRTWAEALWDDSEPLIFGTEHGLDQPADQSEPTDADGLDPRTRFLLDLLAKGLKDEAIARAVGLSTRTVRRRFSELQESLNAANRVQLVARAVQRNWVSSYPVGDGR